ncbi:MAG TPA: hypothetical protein VI279_01730 [Rhodocyclaceae bacterium]
MKQESPFKIRYIPPGIVRAGEYDFCLEYEEDGLRLLLNGVLKSGDSKGLLYFPSTNKWDEHFPSFQGQRERIKANIIEYAKTSFWVEFVADYLSDEEQIIAAENSLLEKRAKETVVDGASCRAFLAETETARTLLHRLRSRPQELPINRRIGKSAIRVILMLLAVFSIFLVIVTIKHT